LARFRAHRGDGVREFARVEVFAGALFAPFEVFVSAATVHAAVQANGERGSGSSSAGRKKIVVGPAAGLRRPATLAHVSSRVLHG